MSAILAYFTIRTILLSFSSIFSIFVVLVLTNIITAADIAGFLNLSEDSTTALARVVDRFQEVLGGIVNVLSNLLNKILSAVGVDVTVSDIESDFGKNIDIEGIQNDVQQGFQSPEETK